MNKYNFKLFEGAGSRLSNYTISYGRSGTFFFSSAFCRRENLKKYSRVYLFFDKSRNAVAFKFLEENLKGSFALIKPKKQTTASVSARSFLISNEIAKKDFYGKKIPKKIIDQEFGELYVIDLLPDVPAE